MNTQNIPIYVQELMKRATFDRTYTNPESEPGYTIKIRKSTPYTRASTLKTECSRLVAWANRVVPHFDDCPIAKILDCPKKTRYCSQFALVTIYDPVMKNLEKYMEEP